MSNNLLKKEKNQLIKKDIKYLNDCQLILFLNLHFLNTFLIILLSIIFELIFKPKGEKHLLRGVAWQSDNTPIPYIIVTDDGFQNQQTTKYFVWESADDSVQASVIIAAKSP